MLELMGILGVTELEKGQPPFFFTEVTTKPVNQPYLIDCYRRIAINYVLHICGENMIESCIYIYYMLESMLDIG